MDFVITAIGKDQPGLVEQLSSVVRAHEGNWLESSMANLAGKFAGIVRVGVPDHHAIALKSALEALTTLKVVVETAADELMQPTRLMSLALMGHDRIGIVQEVAAVLARFAVNVENLETHTSSAAMSGETLFHAHAELAVNDAADIDALKSALEAISMELFVEITLADA